MRQFGSWALAVGVLLALTSSATARVIAPPPLPMRVAGADMILLGRVMGFEDMDVEASLVPGGPKVKYRIAIVTVGELLRGRSELKTMKVGFQLPVPPAGKGIVIKRPPTPHLEIGREYVLMLHKHHEGNFIQVEQYYEAIEVLPEGKSDKEIALIKRCIQLLREPKTSLQSKDAEERFLTAAMLIQNYRGRPTTKTEPVGADESRLILKTLQDVEDWSKFDPNTRSSALTLFQQLGLKAEDGWQPPQNVKDYNREMTAAAQTWLRDRAATYRIQRFVAP